MERLTHRDVLRMTKQERKDKLNYYEDLCCNTDYITNEIEYSIYAKNAEILISKITFNEY